MKQMTKIENIIMNRSGCNRETANLIANDILQEVEKDLQAEVAREIFEDLDNLAQFIQVPSEFKDGCLMITNSHYLCIKPSDYAELKKKYTEGE